MNRLNRGKPAAVLALGVAALAARADTVFVNQAATGANNGQSWADAFTGLQAGLAAAGPGDQVWVAKGTYKPAPPGGSRDAAFALMSGVEVYGGFVGNETSLARRDPVANPTILSGDLNGNDTPGFGNITENSRHVVTAIDAAGALLDGFTVRAGNANFPPELLLGGGGLYVVDGSPSVRGCVFTANSAGHTAPGIGGFGGGMLVNVGSIGADVLVSECRFQGNRGTGGGALGVVNLNDLEDVPHRVTVEDCLFLTNTAPQFGGAVFSSGSAFNSLVDQELSFTRCRFEGNTAANVSAIAEWNTPHFALTDCEFIGNPGGNTVLSGVTFSHVMFPARVRGCLFMDNPHAALGLSATSAEVIGCRFLGNGTPGVSNGALVLGQNGPGGCGGTLTVIGCLFSGNTGDFGAAITSGCAEGIQIVNSTFANNSASTGAGAVSSGAAVVLDNSILWGNSGWGLQTQVGQIAAFTGQAAVNHCTIMGLTGALGGTGNTGADPMFTDPLGPDGVAGTADDDLRLSAGAPAIDAANNFAVPAILTSDLDGNPRFVDDPATPDTGVPGGAGGSAVVDMGAYEFQGCYPDCNADGSLTVADFTCFQTRFVKGCP